MFTLPRRCSLHIIIALSFLIPVISFSQVTIKEKVEIKPKLQGKGPSIVSSDWWPEPGFLTFERGGLLMVGLSFPHNTIPCTLNERAVQEAVEDPAIAWGTYPQWAGSSFSLRSKNPPENPMVFIPHGQSTSMIGGAINSGFLIYCRPEDPELISVAYWLLLLPDSSEAMPPQWYLDYDYGPGDPFDKTRATVLQMPFECSYRIVVMQAKPTANDDVLITLPGTQLLWRNVANHVGDTIVVGPYPRGTQFQLALVSGVKTLVKGDTLYPQAADFGNALEFHFEDWTDETFDDVIIRVEPNAGMPDHLEIAADTDPIWYGDTTHVAILPTDISGNLSPLGGDSDFEFSVELLPESQQYGSLLYNGDAGMYFDHVPSVGGKGVGVQFAANGSEPDSTIFLQFHLREYYSGGIIPSRAGKDIYVQGKLTKGRNSDTKSHPSFLQKKGLNSIAAADKKPVKLKDGVDHLENNWGRGESEHTILLGETRYYQARIVSFESGGSRLRLEERGTPTFSDPNVVKANIWTESSVYRITGEQLAVYWEKRNPNGDALPDGLIRLVGRYNDSQNPNNIFKVGLTASYLGIPGFAVIVVKKPARLLTPDQSPTYASSIDVFSRPISIDSICIYYGGLYGIPPQFIKGQMEKEADHYSNRFNPSYRYEPYTVQFWSRVRNRTTNPYYVQESPVNDPPIPGHANVRTIGYPYPNQKVWQIVSQHSQLVENVDDESHKIYGVRNSDGSMNFSPYDSTAVAKTYRMFLNELLEDYDRPDAISKANDKMIVFLRDKWHGGLKDLYAQTRIASSYGLLQMLYTTALSRGYSEDRTHLPEDINLTSVVMDLSMKYQKKLLQDKLGCPLEESGNWPAGFERSFYSIVYRKWNSTGSYPGSVMSNAQHYLPQN